jgi:hypothetical protein
MRNGYYESITELLAAKLDGVVGACDCDLYHGPWGDQAYLFVNSRDKGTIFYTQMALGKAQRIADLLGRPLNERPQG